MITKRSRTALRRQIAEKSVGWTTAVVHPTDFSVLALHDNEAEVDVLAAGRLMAMNGDQVLAGFDRGLCCRQKGKDVVSGSITGGLQGQNTVDIDLSILVVVEPALKFVPAVS